jgi:serine/threonine protein kinase
LFALKEVIHPDKHDRASFIFEGEVLKRLDHPALPRVYQVFERDQLKRVYLLMDYIEGRNLEVLSNEQPGQRFTLPLVLALMSPIIDAVSYLHQQDPPIVHRDIRPANIIVPVGADEAVLVDFGSAKEYVAGEATTILTHRSPGYAAPEQYGSGTMPLTDIYGLGATLYTLLTGIVPTDAITRITIRNRSKGSDPLKSVNVLVPDVPVGIAEAIECAMSLDAHDRFLSVDEFWKAINTSTERAPARDAPTRNVDTGDLQVPTDMPKIAVTSPLPVIEAMEAPSPVGDLPTIPMTPPIFAQVERIDTSSARQWLEERRRNISARRWIVLVVLAIVIILSAVAGIWFVVFHHPFAALLIPTPTVELATPAPILGLTTYPMLAATYTGTILDVSTNVKSNISLIGIRQKQGKISGYLIVNSNLQESGPFSGTIDTIRHLKFTVRGSGGQPILFFEGTVQSMTSLSGDYYHCGHSQVGRCLRTTSGYGIWNVVQA